MISRVGLPGGLVVDAAPVADIVTRGASLISTQRGLTPARVITALHVGGLQSSADAEFRGALRNADLVCADGAAVVALLRLGGATAAERAPTTDVGLEILVTAARAHSDLRIALVGGRGDLAERAGHRLAAATATELVFATHGYHESWEEVVLAIQRARPDVIILGLGSPVETKWADLRRHDLPGVILTCGGWFGFLADEESRAPRILQRSSLEWTWRLAQAPRRLARRYAVGGLITLRMALVIAARRLTK
jgi:N-acetylglucosaminyldiphosphoundecaprenol N-acetyl-beta-D-mannosaminyltransferase